MDSCITCDSRTTSGSSMHCAPCAVAWFQTSWEKANINPSRGNAAELVQATLEIAQAQVDQFDLLWGTEGYPMGAWSGDAGYGEHAVAAGVY